MVRIGLVAPDDAVELISRRLARVGAVVERQISGPVGQGEAGDRDIEAWIVTAEHVPSQLSAVLAAGRPTLVYGPLGHAAGDVERWLAEADARQAVLTWGQPLRFLPAVEAMRESLVNGKLGDPGLVRLHRWSAADSTRSAADLTRLLDDIDLVLMLFADLPERVFATGDPGSVQVHLGFPRGGMALLDDTVALPGGDYFSLSLIGSSGAAYADDHHNSQLCFAESGLRGVPTGTGETHEIAMLRAFVDGVSSGRSPSVPVTAALRAWRVLEAVHGGLETGEAVSPAGGAA